MTDEKNIGFILSQYLQIKLVNVGSNGKKCCTLGKTALVESRVGIVVRITQANDLGFPDNGSIRLIVAPIGIFSIPISQERIVENSGSLHDISRAFWKKECSGGNGAQNEGYHGNAEDKTHETRGRTIAWNGLYGTRSCQDHGLTTSCAQSNTNSERVMESDGEEQKELCQLLFM